MNLKREKFNNNSDDNKMVKKSTSSKNQGNNSSDADDKNKKKNMRTKIICLKMYCKNNSKQKYTIHIDWNPSMFYNRFLDGKISDMID